MVEEGAEGGTDCEAEEDEAGLGDGEVVAFDEDDGECFEDWNGSEVGQSHEL